MSCQLGSPLPRPDEDDDALGTCPGDPEPPVSVLPANVENLQLFGQSQDLWSPAAQQVGKVLTENTVNVAVALPVASRLVQLLERREFSQWRVTGWETAVAGHG